MDAAGIKALIQQTSSYKIEKMMKDADKDGDGTIDYEEFLKAFSYAFAKWFWMKSK